MEPAATGSAGCASSALTLQTPTNSESSEQHTTAVIRGASPSHEPKSLQPGVIPKHDSSPDGCDICADLWDVFTIKDVFEIKLPCLDEIPDTPCAGHDPLFQYIRKEMAGYTDRPLYVGKERVSGPATFHTEGRIINGEMDWGPKLRFVVVSTHRDDSLMTCYGRILNPGWIDIGLVKDWIRSCLTLHGALCTNPLGIDHVSPDWLIDTSNACIVPGQGIVDYVALSYRWGTSESFRMGTESFKIEMVRKPGALAEAYIADTMPSSITDVMKLVRWIGERYLWVDALCIDQSDEARLSQQVEMMGSIYASAKLTIVASDGDATSGLEGLRGISPPRGAEQVILPLFGTYKVIRTQSCRFYNTSHNRKVMRFLGIEGDSEYFQRGWTHQEFYLSKRRLIIYKQRVFWQCMRADMCEDLVQRRLVFPRDEYHDSSNLQASSLLAGVPDLDMLGIVLRDYNGREHSYTEDALPGILGLQAILSRSFEGGFLCGLPEACFDAALMWCTTSDPSQARRRVNSGKSRVGLLYPLPSWSWIGWQTPNLAVAQGETLNMVGTDFCKTTPITQWFAHESPRSDLKRLIKPTWLDFRESLKTSPTDLPPPWAKRDSGGVSSRIFPPAVEAAFGVDTGYVYYHSGEPGREYGLPFPIATAYEEKIPWNPPQTPFISCKTKRGWFTAGRVNARDYRFRFLGGKRLLLSSEKFDNCGTIEPHEAIDTLLGATTDGRLKVELVAICLQMQRNRTIFGDDEWYHVYGVLWVQWIDGIAYRRGSGVVYKTPWEEHNLEDVDLILG